MIKSDLVYNNPTKFDCYFFEIDFDTDSQNQNSKKYLCKVKNEVENGQISTKLKMFEDETKLIQSFDIGKLEWGFLDIIDIMKYFKEDMEETKILIEWAQAADANKFFEDNLIFVTNENDAFQYYSIQSDIENFKLDIKSVYATTIYKSFKWSAMPTWQIEKQAVGFLEDESKTFEIESYLYDYYSSNFFLVKGSTNFHNINDKENIRLLYNYANVPNSYKNLYLSLVRKEKKLKLYSKSNNNYSLEKEINLDNIYNCSVFHNVIPFTIKDKNSLPNSYCCISFPLSTSDFGLNGTVVQDICINNTQDYTCLIEAKILQKNILDICTMKDKFLRKLYENSVEQSRKSITMSSSTGTKRVEAFSDSDKEMGGTSHYLHGEFSKVSTNEPTHSPKVDLYSLRHAYDTSDDGIYTFKYLTYNYVEKNLPIDYKKFIPLEITRPLVLRNYHPLVITNEQAIKLYKESIHEEGDINRFKADSHQLPHRLKMLDAAASVPLSLDLNKTPVKVHDKTSSPHMDQDAQKYWTNFLQDSGITSLQGEGKAMDAEDVLYAAEDRAMQDQSPPSAGTKVVSLPDWDIQYVDDMTVKYFKTDGIRNGDVMFQKKKCCPVFKSAKTRTEFENCGSVVRIRDPDGKQHYMDYAGNPTEPDVFWCQSCYVPLQLLNGGPYDKLAMRKGNNWVLPDNTLVRLEDSTLTLQCKKRVVRLDPSGLQVENTVHPFASITTGVANQSTIVSTVAGGQVVERVTDTQGHVVSTRVSGSNPPTSQAFSNPQFLKPYGSTPHPYNATIPPQQNNLNQLPINPNPNDTTSTQSLQNTPFGNVNNPGGVVTLDPYVPQKVKSNYEMNSNPLNPNAIRINPQIQPNSNVTNNPQLPIQNSPAIQNHPSTLITTNVNIPNNNVNIPSNNLNIPNKIVPKVNSPNNTQNGSQPSSTMNIPQIESSNGPPNAINGNPNLEVGTPNGTLNAVPGNPAQVYNNLNQPSNPNPNLGQQNTMNGKPMEPPINNVFNPITPNNLNTPNPNGNGQNPANNSSNPNPNISHASSSNPGEPQAIGSVPNPGGDLHQPFPYNQPSVNTPDSPRPPDPLLASSNPSNQPMPPLVYNPQTGKYVPQDQLPTLPVEYDQNGNPIIPANPRDQYPNLNPNYPNYPNGDLHANVPNGHMLNQNPSDPSDPNNNHYGTDKIRSNLNNAKEPLFTPLINPKDQGNKNYSSPSEYSDDASLEYSNSVKPKPHLYSGGRVGSEVEESGEMDGNTGVKFTNVFLRSEEAVDAKLSQHFDLKHQPVIHHLVLPDGTSVYETTQLIYKILITGQTVICPKDNSHLCYSSKDDSEEHKSHDYNTFKNKVVVQKRSANKRSSTKDNPEQTIVVNENIIARIKPDGSYIVDNKMLKQRYIRNQYGIGKLIDLHNGKTKAIKNKLHFSYQGDHYFITELDEIIVYSSSGASEIYYSDGDYQKLDKSGHLVFFVDMRKRVQFYFDLVEPYVQAYDMIRKIYFRFGLHSFLVRNPDDGYLYELFYDAEFPELKIESDLWKSYEEGVQKNYCFYNGKGIRVNSLDANHKQICDCNKDYYMIQVNSCREEYTNTNLNEEIKEFSSVTIRKFELYDFNKRAKIVKIVKKFLIK